MSCSKNRASKIIACILAVVLSFAIVSAAAEPASAASGQYTQVEGKELYSWNFEVLKFVNADRAKAGSRPVVMDANMMEYATQRAYELYFLYDHTRPNGKDSFSISPNLERSGEWMGEIIFMQLAEDSSPQAINTAFYNSLRHREIMLDSHYTCVGVGCVHIGDWIYIAEIFGGPSLSKQTVTSSQYSDTTRVRSVDTGVCKSKFSDVPLNSYYCDAVNWAADANITKGTSATQFSPNADCTRAQVVTFLWRASGSPEPLTKTCPFTDVPSNAFYYKAVLWASELAITAGTSRTTFSPNDTCTRAQVVTFLWRANGARRPSTMNSPFRDVPSNAYYCVSVIWANENNITKGTSATQFSPNDTCTRAQVVTFLYRAAH